MNYNTLSKEELIKILNKRDADCADIKDMSEQYEKSESFLKHRESTYQFLVETMGDGLIRIDNRQQIVFANYAFSELLACDTEKIIGKPINDLIYHVASGRVGLKPIASDPESFERVLIHKSGKHIDVFVTSRTIYDVNGEKDGFVSVITQITQLKKIEEELRASEEKLQKANSSKDKFFSIIAHDLKGPFSGFLGLSKTMVDGLKVLEPEDLAELAKDLKDSAGHLYKLLENLLEWSRLQRGHKSFDAELFAPYLIIDQAIGLISGNAKQKEITLTCEVSEELTGFGDRNMIHTIIRNLLSNAVKFTPRGGKIELTVIELDDDFLEFSIIDSGVGMDEATINKLFKIDTKVSTPGTENEPSTGLGLILCRELAEKNGGTVNVQSALGKGSTFSFTLPRSGSDS